MRQALPRLEPAVDDQVAQPDVGLLGGVAGPRRRDPLAGNGLRGHVRNRTAASSRQSGSTSLTPPPGLCEGAAVSDPAGDRPAVDWDEVREWDETHYAHVFVTAGEYEHRAIARRRRRLPRARRRDAAARLHERPPVRERRAPQRADPDGDRRRARPLRLRPRGLGDGLPRTRREADRRRRARAGRLGRADPLHLLRLGGGRARAARREARHRPAERHLARLRLPRLDARRALADGPAGLTRHPRRRRLRRDPPPGRHPDAGRVLRAGAVLLQLPDRAHVSRPASGAARRSPASTRSST